MGDLDYSKEPRLSPIKDHPKACGKISELIDNLLKDKDDNYREHEELIKILTKYSNELLQNLPDEFLQI